MDNRRFSPVLLSGDVAAFVLFAVVGLSSHEQDYSPAAFARTVLPFLLPWLVTAGVAGLYRRRTDVGPSSVIKPVLIAWLPAWAAGLALRSLVWGRAFSPAFAIVALLVNAALLLGWRATAAALQKDNVQAS